MLLLELAKKIGALRESRKNGQEDQEVPIKCQYL